MSTFHVTITLTYSVDAADDGAATRFVDRAVTLDPAHAATLCLIDEDVHAEQVAA